MNAFRTGFGYDLHRLAAGRELWLGGIRIDFEKGAIAHSDGDTLIHAICDALLGAAALGDIGQHFPDNDPAYKNADSKKLLSDTVELLSKRSFKIANIDSTIVIETPRMSPYIGLMREMLSEVMGIENDRISIKAKTSEGISEIGRGEAVAAYAVCLLYQE